jgi:glycosyltransferase involved in cell wall biosynthesis
MAVMVKTPLVTLYCANDQPTLERLVTHAPEAWPNPTLLKHDKGTTVTLLRPATPPAIVIKHHRFLTWRRWLDVLAHGSPAHRSWKGAQLLQAQGFPVPRPLGVFEKRGAGVVQESWYCSEGLLTQLPLDRYWRQQGEHWSLTQRRIFLRALAEFLRAFHRAGLYAGDMRDANLLVEETEPQQWRFYLVDLDRIVQTSALSEKRRIRNLVHLDRTLGRNVRLSDRLFFLHCYWESQTLSRQQRQQFIQRLLRIRRQKDKEYIQRRQKQRRKQTRMLHVTEAMTSASSSGSTLTIPREPISSFIICFNEEANIRQCLESVKWCDEIIIVDSFSTDRTLEICREYTDRIIQRPWPGYVAQKRFALAQMTHEWGLNIDADEEVSPELRSEILHVLQRNDPAVDGFYISRFIYYLGRWWRRGWYPEYRLRLFRKHRVRWGGVDPHEKALLRGHAEHLYGDLYHYTYKNIHHHLRALNSLTEVAAQEKRARGKQSRTTALLLRPLWRFLRMYLQRGTAIYGVAGFFVSITAAFYVFLKYAKLWESISVSQPQSSAQDFAHRPRESLGGRRSPGHGVDNVSA